MKGEPALELLVQMAEPTLRRLWKGERDEMLLIQRAPHGAKVGTISRDYAVERLRWGAGQSGVDERQRGKLRSLADSLVAGPPHDCVQCLVQGWGVDLVIPLRFLSLPAGHRTGFKDDDARVLHEYIVACRDQRRALGALEKCLDKLSSTSMASLLAELVALARHHWDDCDAILAKLEDVARAGRELSNTPAGARLVLVRMAMYQATMDRKQGGAVNAAGGSA